MRTVNLSRRPSLFPLLLPSSSSFSIPLNKHELRSTGSQAFFLGRGLGAGTPQSLEGERKGTDGQTDICYLYNVISTVGGNKEPGRQQCIAEGVMGKDLQSGIIGPGALKPIRKGPGKADSTHWPRRAAQSFLGTAVI